MKNIVTIRQAKIEDVDFIIDTIIEAEKSGTDKIVSTKIFELSEIDFREILKEVLLMDIPDYEYSLSGFNVAEYNNTLIGALGSWIESESGTPSSLIKGSILSSFLNDENIKKTMQLLQQLKEFVFPKTKGSIQIEYAYVLPEYRRKKVFSNLIIYSIKQRLDGKSIPRVETALMKNNFKSFNCYEKFGFHKEKEIVTENPGLIEIFPYNIKTLLTKEGEELIKLINGFNEPINLDFSATIQY